MEHFKRGFELHQNGNLDGAITEYQTALRSNPNVAEVHHVLGIALAGKGDLDGAIAEQKTGAIAAPAQKRYDTPPMVTIRIVDRSATLRNMRICIAANLSVAEILLLMLANCLRIIESTMPVVAKSVPPAADLP